jgi:hypothetical protein
MRILRLVALTVVAMSCLAATRLRAQASTPRAVPSDVGPSVATSALTGIRRPPGRLVWNQTVAAGRAFAVALGPLADADASHRKRNVLVGAIVGAAAGVVFASATCDDDCILSPLGGAALGMIVALLLTPVR